MAPAHLAPVFKTFHPAHIAAAFQLGRYHAGEFLYVVLALGGRQRRQKALHGGAAQHVLDSWLQLAFGMGVAQQAENRSFHQVHGFGVLDNEADDLVAYFFGVGQAFFDVGVFGYGFGDGGQGVGGLFGGDGLQAVIQPESVYLVQLRGGGRGE